MSLINLPRDLVIQICMFTGKFILLPNGKLKSIVDMRDFEHLSPLLLNKRFYSINTMMRTWDREEVMNKKERQKSHLLHLQNTDYKKHSWLFLKEESLELMTPIEPRLFCSHCKNNLSSEELDAHQNRFIKFGIYGYRRRKNSSYMISYLQGTRGTDCINCVFRKIDVNDDKKEPIKYIMHAIPNKQFSNSRMKIPKMKSFRILK